MENAPSILGLNNFSPGLPPIKHFLVGNAPKIAPTDMGWSSQTLVTILEMIGVKAALNMNQTVESLNLAQPPALLCTEALISVEGGAIDQLSGRMGCTGCSEENCGSYGPDHFRPWRIECNGCSKSFVSVGVAEQFREYHRKRLGLDTPVKWSLSRAGISNRKHKALIANRKPKNSRNLDRSIPDKIVEELKSVLEGLGFEVTTLIDFGLVPVKEQVRLTQQADLLISPHGGQVTNCVFLPTGSVVIELFPMPAYMGCYFKAHCESVSSIVVRVWSTMQSDLKAHEQCDSLSHVFTLRIPFLSFS